MTRSSSRPLPLPETGRIVVTGSVAFDYLMRFPGRFVEHLVPDRMDRLSVSFLVDEMRRVPGGCGSNIAYGLALLGERPLLLATAGRDAAEYRDWLAREGVDVSSLVLDPDLFTASFFVSTDRDNNQLASFYTGAMARARDLTLAGTVADDAAFIVISPNDPDAMARYASESRELGIPFLYDPSQQVARLSGEDLLSGIEGAFLLITNDYEFGILRQKTGLSRERLEERVPVLVVTHGADGSTISVAGPRERESYEIPAARLEQPAIDPTGVGDAYRAGLLRGIRIGVSWEIAGRIGSVAAAIVLETLGAQPQRYGPEEFGARYARSFGEEPRLERLFSDRYPPG
ncbi:MAG TPA: carbohydrate kinase family protein [Thermoanaerobaculia bacterium]|nr:carbohydrate kinase family protein [Thermoanaerobaculia bacterium]